MHGWTYFLDQMHACLHVDEIVRLIACELVSSRGLATAVAFACCCRSFEDPALDGLWEIQNRLNLLLKTLPEDVWDVGERTVSARASHLASSLNHFIRKCFRRLPTTLELARFRKYAQRMRKFRGFAGSLRGITPEVCFVLQHSSFNEPLLPNLKTFELLSTTAEFAPFIPLFVSPRTTHIDITFTTRDLSKALVASTINTFSALCPSLQHIGLHSLPRDPMIIKAVSELLLTINRATLRSFDVDSPLTVEAREVVHKLPDLCKLTVVTEKGTSLRSLILPSLTKLVIVQRGHDRDPLDWSEMFYGATLGKLETIDFDFEPKKINDLLGAFERAALAASVQNTLSEFALNTTCSWNPKFSSLLSFTQMKNLDIHFSCDDGCSSRVDDDVIINLARAMPKLKTLLLGDEPCHRIAAGVTAKGLMVLAHYCPNLFSLCIHFHVASLGAPPTTPGMTPNAVEPDAPRRDCALRNLTVGDTLIPEQSMLMVTMTLVRIFPRIENISYVNLAWGRVANAIRLSKKILDC